MTLTALNPTTPVASTPARNTDSLKAANNAASLAEDSLKQIGQLQASLQPGDVYTLQKLQALANTALSQANGIVPEGQADIQAASSNAGYLAQAALQKIAQRLSLSSTSQAEAQVPEHLNLIA
jgi:hypothetical protein